MPIIISGQSSYINYSKLNNQRERVITLDDFKKMNEKDAVNFIAENIDHAEITNYIKMFVDTHINDESSLKMLINKKGEYHFTFTCDMGGNCRLFAKCEEKVKKQLEKMIEDRGQNIPNGHSTSISPKGEQFIENRNQQAKEAVTARTEQKPVWNRSKTAIIMGNLPPLIRTNSAPSLPISSTSSFFLKDNLKPVSPDEVIKKIPSLNNKMELSNYGGGIIINVPGTNLVVSSEVLGNHIYDGHSSNGINNDGKTILDLTKGLPESIVYFSNKYGNVAPTKEFFTQHESDRNLVGLKEAVGYIQNKWEQVEHYSKGAPIQCLLNKNDKDNEKGHYLFIIGDSNLVVVYTGKQWGLITMY
jgi:hypothetical protein